MSGDTIFLMMTGVMAMSTIAMVTAMLAFRRAKQDLTLTQTREDDLRPILQDMRRDLDEMGVQIERVAESQRFTAQLQVERAETLRLLQTSGPRTRDER